MGNEDREKAYIAVDLKSFYASVECVERGLNPLDTLLVVADESRTEKTICLAVSPALKAYGIPGRARLFEVVERMREVNAQRLRSARIRRFSGSSRSAGELAANAAFSAAYIAAPPRMALYIKYSTAIYGLYLQFVSAEDIHVYSVDEVFMDVTHYLRTYRMTAEELAAKIVRAVYERFHITATAGVGTNLYLAKIAMDVVAKHMPPDETNARIASLNASSYRRLLWTHRPLTDFWRVGTGYAKRLYANGIFTMGDIARLSLTDEDLLYRMFGVNAELLIDHAWGMESVSLPQIKAYRPDSSSLGSGQVLQCPYSFAGGRLIVKEMTDRLTLELVDRGLVTKQLTLTVGYDVSSLQNPEIRKKYRGEITADWYGRSVPKHAHGSVTLDFPTSSGRLLTEAAARLYERIVDPDLLIRRCNITANNVVSELDALREETQGEDAYTQLELFTDYEALARADAARKKSLEKEKRAQKAALSIQKKFGKNALLKGMNFEEGATMRERNNQIGGHKA